jgi:hypothetical protein
MIERAMGDIGGEKNDESEWRGVMIGCSKEGRGRIMLR